MNLERQPRQAFADSPEPGEEGLLSPQVGTEFGHPDEAEPHVVIGHRTGRFDLAIGDPAPGGSSFIATIIRYMCRP